MEGRSRTLMGVGEKTLEEERKKGGSQGVALSSE